MCVEMSVLLLSDVTVDVVVCSCDPFFRRAVECVAILEAISIGVRGLHTHLSSLQMLCTHANQPPLPE